MRRGQIFSLDFMLSIVLVVLAIGLSMQFLELQTYHQKDLELRDEIEIVGFAASDLLVSNPNVVCEITAQDGSVVGSMPNCLGTDGTGITKELLGIPATYGCSLSGIGVNFFGSGCSESDSLERDVFAIKRSIVYYPSKEVSKAELEDCMQGLGEPECLLKETTVELRVWKA